MRYYRSLPRLNLIFKLLKCSCKSPKIEVAFSSVTNTGKYHAYFFSRSRYTVLAFLNSLIANNDHIQVVLWIPNFYCWEVAKIWDIENVKIRFYPISKDYSPVWAFFDNKFENDKKIKNVFFSVNFFGISTDVNKVRLMCKENDLFLIFDETHVRYSNIIPQHNNEMVLLSPYKHFSISNGAVAIVKKCTSFSGLSISKLFNEYIPTLSVTNRFNLLFTDSLWLAKSFIVNMLKRVKIEPFNTILRSNNKKSILKVPNSKIKLGISEFNYRLIEEFSSQTSRGVTSQDFVFYNKLVEVISAYIPCKVVSHTLNNSNLFGVKLNTEKEAKLVYNLFSEYKLPVSTWPDYSFSNAFEEDCVDEIVMDLITTTVYLASPFNTAIPVNIEADDFIIKEIGVKFKNKYAN